jgi:hypothetical protein
MTSAEKLAALRAPRPSSDLEWLVVATNKEKTKGLAVPYLPAAVIHGILDSVLGAENWRNEYVPWADTGAVCMLSLRLDGEWITKSDGAPFPETEPVKGVFSNAFKRAAGVWGVGRYLHAFPGTWVPVEPVGKSVRMKENPILPDELLPHDERGTRRPSRGQGSAAAGDGPERPAPTPPANPSTPPRRTDPPAPGGKALISPHQLRTIPELAKTAGVADADLAARIRAFGVDRLDDMTAKDAATVYMELNTAAQAAKKKGK